MHNLIINFTVIDLSLHSATGTKFIDSERSLISSSSEKRISDEFEKAFQKPCFNNVRKRKRKMQCDENTPICSTVDDMLEALEKKESAKRLKDEQLKQKQVNRAKKKVLRDQELNMKREFNEKKKNLLLQKKDLKLQIQNVKKELKSTNEESLQNKLRSMENQLEDLERSIKIEELAILQKTLYIKKEIV